MVPGPLGMLETNPSADAPHEMAVSASLIDLIQQTFTLGTTFQIWMSARMVQAISKYIREIET